MKTAAFCFAATAILCFTLSSSHTIVDASSVTDSELRNFVGGDGCERDASAATICSECFEDEGATTWSKCDTWHEARECDGYEGMFKPTCTMLNPSPTCGGIKLTYTNQQNCQNGGGGMPQFSACDRNYLYATTTWDYNTPCPPGQ